MEQRMEREGESYGKEGRADKNGKTELETKLQALVNISEERESRSRGMTLAKLHVSILLKLCLLKRP